MKIVLLSDQAIRLEPDSGPLTIDEVGEQQYSPFHMLASSLAFCTYSVLYSWASHTSQTAEDLVIEVRWKFSDDDEPHRVSEMHMTFTWPSLPEKKREAAKRVLHMCTIHQTLLRPPAITVDAA